MNVKVTTEERLAKAAARAEKAAERCEKLVDSIVFVVLAEQGLVDEVTATEHEEIFAAWKPDVKYFAGNLRRYPESDGKLYKCLQNHKSQADWTPDAAVSLWAVAGDPTEEWPEWSQPIGAQDAYMSGDTVSHNEKHWVSDYDNNVWEPGVFGWHEDAGN